MADAESKLDRQTPTKTTKQNLGRGRDPTDVI